MQTMILGAHTCIVSSIGCDGANVSHRNLDRIAIAGRSVMRCVVHLQQSTRYGASVISQHEKKSILALIDKGSLSIDPRPTMPASHPLGPGQRSVLSQANTTR